MLKMVDDDKRLASIRIWRETKKIQSLTKLKRVAKNIQLSKDYKYNNNLNFFNILVLSDSNWLNHSITTVNNINIMLLL